VRFSQKLTTEGSRLFTNKEFFSQLFTILAQVWASESQYVPGAQDWVCLEWPLQAKATEAEQLRATAQIKVRIIVFLLSGHTRAS
jgi:hypothetical protein